MLEDVRIICWEGVFGFMCAALFGSYMARYLGEPLRGICDVGGWLRGIVVGHNG